MSDLGPKIIEGLKQAIAGDLARVTIEGVTWVRKDELDRLRAEKHKLMSFINSHEPFGDNVRLQEELDRLRAENAQNDRTIAAMEDVQRKLDAENSRLRAELEQCRDRLHLYADAPRQRRNRLTCQHEPSAVDPECPYCLRIEIDRLCAEREIFLKDAAQWRAENERLRAENERLRGAIQNVYAAVARITTEVLKETAKEEE